MMSAPTTGSLVGVLKQKMLDTKEEVEKVKGNIQDMTREIQVPLVRILSNLLFTSFSRLKLNGER